MQSNDRPALDVSATDRLSVGGLLAFNAMLLGALVVAIHPWIAAVGGLGAVGGFLFHDVADSR